MTDFEALMQSSIPPYDPQYGESRHLFVGKSVIQVRLNQDIFKHLVEPESVKASEVGSYPQEDHEVIGIVLNGIAKGYPQRIVSWHHNVNDVIGDCHIDVSFCPLCGMAIVYETLINGYPHIMGCAGLSLDKNNMLLYDEATMSLWLQASGECFWGKLKGQVLKPLPAVHTGWAAWKAMHPDTLVITPNTGFRKINYQEFPRIHFLRGSESYETYRVSDTISFLTSRVDRRMHPKDLIVAVKIEGETKAYPFAILYRNHVINDIVGGKKIVVMILLHQHLAYGTNIPINQQWQVPVGIFERTIHGQELTFNLRGEFVDMETQSIWDISGRAKAGPLIGYQLKPLVYVKSFWFSWITTHSDTKVYGGFD